MNFLENKMREIVREEISSMLGFSVHQCNHCYCIGNYNQPLTAATNLIHQSCCKCGDRKAILNFISTTTINNSNPYYNDSAVQGKLF